MSLIAAMMALLATIALLAWGVAVWVLRGGHDSLDSHRGGIS